MTSDRTLLIERVAQSIQAKSITDVHQLASELQKDFPDVTEPELVSIITEQVIRSHGNCVWAKRQG